MELALHMPEMLNQTAFDTKMFIAAKLFEGGRLSSGHAAELAGVSKRTFLELCGEYGVSIFQQSADEIRQDIANAEKLLQEDLINRRGMPKE